jgi:hypothetical protein
LGAAKVAAFNGWTLAVFAAVSILFGLFSLTGFLVGVGLAVVARNELLGRRRILAYDPGGFTLLWRNQVGLMALIVVYCAWSMYRTTAAPERPRRPARRRDQGRRPLRDRQAGRLPRRLGIGGRVERVGWRRDPVLRALGELRDPRRRRRQRGLAREVAGH